MLLGVNNVNNDNATAAMSLGVHKFVGKYAWHILYSENIAQTLFFVTRA